MESLTIPVGRIPSSKYLLRAHMTRSSWLMMNGEFMKWLESKDLRVLLDGGAPENMIDQKVVPK